MAAVESAVGGGAVAVIRPPGEVEQADVVRDLTAEERQAFVAFVAANKGCSVWEACKAVGVRRRDVRALRKADSEFAEDYATARGYGAEQILGGMVKLALEGVEEPIVSAGKIVLDADGQPLVKRVYDSRALIALFNGMTPEGKSMMAGKLGIEISGPDGGPIKVQQGVSLADVMAFVRLHVPQEQLDQSVAGELVAEEDGGPA